MVRAPGEVADVHPGPGRRGEGAGPPVPAGGPGPVRRGVLLGGHREDHHRLRGRARGRDRRLHRGHRGVERGPAGHRPARLGFGHGIAGTRRLRRLRGRAGTRLRLRRAERGRPRLADQARGHRQPLADRPPGGRPGRRRGAGPAPWTARRGPTPGWAGSARSGSTPGRTAGRASGHGWPAASSRACSSRPRSPTTRCPRCAGCSAAPARACASPPGTTSRPPWSPRRSRSSAGATSSSARSARNSTCSRCTRCAAWRRARWEPSGAEAPAWCSPRRASS